MVTGNKWSRLRGSGASAGAFQQQGFLATRYKSRKTTFEIAIPRDEQTRFGRLRREAISLGRGDFQAPIKILRLVVNGYLVAGGIEIIRRTEITKTLEVETGWCRLRSRFTISQGDVSQGEFQAPHKIMNFVFKEILALVEFLLSKSFDTAILHDGGRNVWGRGRGFVVMAAFGVVVVVTAISKSFKITIWHDIGRIRWGRDGKCGGKGEVLYSSRRLECFAQLAKQVAGMVVGTVRSASAAAHLSASATTIIAGKTQGINGSREAEKAGISNEGLGDHCRIKYEGK
jgi:hypothetical protein